MLNFTMFTRAFVLLLGSQKKNLNFQFFKHIRHLQNDEPRSRPSYFYSSFSEIEILSIYVKVLPTSDVCISGENCNIKYMKYREE